ncbi:hypothetical protein PSECIP111951_01879 [Pseudoalteromonas holothuriae]|uniref:Uncharacterized protein n=1 Tax=Pseudoalteromonas holothuriae TaxID=2963714 RepID=A0ABN8UKT5_9GAMM|nr:hypothetical protein [Pseudoalteromonas sp. CIP111951]CAH9058452.1 hypothetical protein PSECIP111951_01879 [Pseudoalteromonas sp. CIP111951]
MSRIFSYIFWGTLSVGFVILAFGLAIGTLVSGERILFGLTGFLTFFLLGASFLICVWVECNLRKQNISPEDMSKLVSLHPLTSGSLGSYAAVVVSIALKYKKDVSPKKLFILKSLPFNIYISIPMFVAMALIAVYKVGF